MKYLSSVFFIITVLLGIVSCKEDRQFTLYAELNNLPNDPLYVVFDEPDARIDTIYPDKGKFIYSFPADSLSGSFQLITADGRSIPFFFKAGVKVHLQGNFDRPQIEGDGENQVYGDFLSTVNPLKDKPEEVQKEAEKFIREHPSSLVSAYILNQYFIQTEKPNPDKIKQLMKPMAGSIKDSWVLSMATQSMPQETAEMEYLPYITYKDRNGNYVYWQSKEGLIAVVVLWASWDGKSQSIRERLWQLSQKYLADRLVVYNLSLDYDKQLWLSQCKSDTEQWKELCDFKGFQTAIAKELKVQKVPMTYIINNNRQIKAKGLVGDDLEQMIKTLIPENR